MKTAIERNRRLSRTAEFEEITRYALEDRVTYATVIESLLANNLEDQEIQYVILY